MAFEIDSIPGWICIMVNNRGKVVERVEHEEFLLERARHFREVEYWDAPAAVDKAARDTQDKFGVRVFLGTPQMIADQSAEQAVLKHLDEIMRLDVDWAPVAASREGEAMVETNLMNRADLVSAVGDLRERLAQSEAACAIADARALRMMDALGKVKSGARQTLQILDEQGGGGDAS